MKKIEDFSNSKFLRIIPYVGIKKCRDKKMSRYNMNPSQTTNHTYIGGVS